MATYKGKFVLTQRQKYRGDPNKIEFRSSWEYAFMHWCDTNPRCLKWNSEEIRIPYLCTINNKHRHYVMDFWVLLDDNIEYLVEIKPAKQTKPPKKPSKKTRNAIQNYLYAESTWVNNMDKWRAAVDYAKQRKYKFVIMTEHKLRKMGIPINA